MQNKSLISITLDDGRLSALSEGAQILEKYGVRGTFYPITNLIGTENEHGKYGSWDDIESVFRRGHEVGNHSHSHSRKLKNLKPQLQREDIAKANELLKDHGIEVKTFAYPYGYYSDTLHETIFEMGFAAARTIDMGINNAGADPLLLRSFMIEDKHKLGDIEKEIATALPFPSEKIISKCSPEPFLPNFFKFSIFTL